MILKLQGVGSFDGTGRLLVHDEQALRNVFWLAAVPGIIALAVLVIVVRDVPRREAGDKGGLAASGAPGGLTKRFWAYLGVVLLFTLQLDVHFCSCGDSSFSRCNAPICGLLNLVNQHSHYGGHLSDRLAEAPSSVAGSLCASTSRSGGPRSGAGWALSRSTGSSTE